MHVPQPAIPPTVRVSSPAFIDGASVPDHCTCRGAGTSPAFSWVGVPAGAASLAVVVSDPDAPRGTFVHWLVVGLPPGDGGFPEGSAPAGARQLANSGRTLGWYPPCPPSGTHRYVFAVHALDAAVRSSSSEDALAEVARRTIAWGSLTGLVSAG